MPNIFISIEGNIGSGKSTVLKIIRQNFPELTILDQPLSCWQKVGEKGSTNLLKLYYQQPQRWGLTFQIYALMTRLMKWGEFSQMRSEEVKISERSLLSDRYIFASIMKDTEILSEMEYQIYLQCYNGLKLINKIAKVQGVIYVQCDPKICSERIKKRARQGETHIPLDYLQKLHNKHEQWLNPISKCNQETQSTNSENSQQPADELSNKKDYNINNSLSQQNNYSISITQQKVLIIDNNDYINKTKIINELRRWLKTFQLNQ